MNAVRLMWFKINYPKAFEKALEKIEVKAKDLLAQAICHEVDHLNWIIFYDRIDKDKQFYSEEEIRLI